MIMTHAIEAFASLQIAILAMAAALFLDLRRTSRRQRMVRSFASALRGWCPEEYPGEMPVTGF
jgi:hypothetical protein